MTHKETYEKYKTLRGQGKTYQEIAEALGKSYETVKTYCIRHDLKYTKEERTERDNGVCWLCGKTCDWSNYEIVDGTFIAGNQYPSIDHVIPLAKGGTHTWDNVKLAHRICNSIKSDKLSPAPLI